jgi:hypothetical protein
MMTTAPDRAAAAAVALGSDIFASIINDRSALRQSVRLTNDFAQRTLY